MAASVSRQFCAEVAIEPDWLVGIDLAEDDGEFYWCIEDWDRPGFYLCGDPVEHDDWIPGEEVPDADTCPACVAVELMLEMFGL